MCIHSTAVVSPEARIGRDVSIGPYSVVEGDVVIGDGCRLENHVTIKSGTTLGRNNHLLEGAVIGGPPQHAKRPDRIGRVEIGTGNVIREYVTIHRALDEEASTVVGDYNLIMVGAHVAHDCRIGNLTLIANNVMLAGHITVEDQAYLSGAVGIHQFCRVGRLAMVGGQAHVVKDIPPYVTIDGASSLVGGLNVVGQRRAGFSASDVRRLKEAYRMIYRSDLCWDELIPALEAEFTEQPAAAFATFLAGSSRGFTQERRLPPGATIKLHPHAEPAVEGPATQADPPRRLAG
ncbi:MAG: acyl-ACP--UDP-N-acetylglucosamine O-acyltransferase [Pirellulales bacterium]